jgi:hypothetical protein
LPALDSRDKIESEASAVPFPVPSSDADEYLTSRPTDDFLPCSRWGSKFCSGLLPLLPSLDALGGGNHVQQLVVAKPDSLAALHGGLLGISRSRMHA